VPSTSGSGFSWPDTPEYLETLLASPWEHKILHKTVVEKETITRCDSKEATFHKDFHGPTVAHGL